jgi:hypothetical protein
MAGLSRITDPQDAVVDIMKRYEANCLGIVKAADLLEDAFKSKGLMYEMSINPRQVGFDPSNRDAVGGNVQEVHLLASDIAFVGFSWSECSHALCCEVMPGDDSVERFNSMISHGVDLAPVLANSIMFGSLSCGHTNYGLRALAAGVPSACPLLSEDGKMSLSKLEKMDPDYAKAVKNGLNWRVLRSSVRVLYPDTLSVLQGARNVSGHVQRKINEVQGLQQLHSLAAAAQARGLEPDWQAIKRAVLRSRPPFADSMDEMVAFLATRSGGIDGQFLKFFLGFHRSFVNPSVRASVPATLYGALAAFPVQYTAIAILEAAFTCPVDSVKQGLCCWVTAPEVFSLGRTNSDMLKEAEHALCQARVLASQANLPMPIHEHNTVLSAFVKLDIGMARFILGKQGSSKQVHNSVASVGRQFVQELQIAFPKHDFSVYERVFPANPALVASAAGTVTTGGGISLYTVDEKGRAVNALARIRENGIDIGSFVASSQSADVFRVASIGGSSAGPAIVLEPHGAEPGAGMVTNVDLEDFLYDWSLRDPKAKVERHPGWPEKRTSATDAAGSLYQKGHAIGALAILGATIEKHFAPANAVDIFAKPVRKVVAKCDFASNCIVLGPDTMNLKVCPRDQDVASDAVELNFKPHDELHRFLLLPAVAVESVSPLWCIASTADEDRANMSWTKVSVSALFGIDFLGKPRPTICLEKGRKKQKTKGPDVVSPEDEAPTKTVIIPVLINHKAVTKGDELLIYKALTAKRPRQASAITIIELAKRAKTSK